MLSKYIQHRKDYVKLTKLRRFGDELYAIGQGIFVITNPSPLTREKYESLRAQELQLLESWDADIPKIVKILPVK